MDTLGKKKTTNCTYCREKKVKCSFAESEDPEYGEEFRFTPSAWPDRLPSLTSEPPVTAVDSKYADTLLFVMKDNTECRIPRHVFEAVPQPIRWYKDIKSVYQVFQEDEQEGRIPGQRYKFPPWERQEAWETA